MSTTTETQPPTKPIIFLDASALKESDCLRRLIYIIHYGFNKFGSNKFLNYKAGYGSAFHRALEYWYKLPQEVRHNKQEAHPHQLKAIELAVNYYEPFTRYVPAENVREFRTQDHLINSILAYFERYTGTADLIEPISLLQETKFDIPYYGCAEFELHLTGTIDLIASFMGQEIFVDHKTTSAWGAPKDYFNEYKLSVQMMFYSWILQKLVGRRLPCMINGVFLKKQGAKSIRFDGANLERSPLITFTDEQMMEFDEWVITKIDRIVEWLGDYFCSEKVEGAFPKPPPNFPSCTGGKFSNCAYFHACSLTPELQDSVLRTWEQYRYNPLTFSE